jgi:hypothetical protein
MFGSKDKGTIIAKGLKIVGSVTAEGLVEVHGQIEGDTEHHRHREGSARSRHRQRPTDRRRWTGRRSDQRRRGDPKIACERYRRYSP